MVYQDKGGEIISVNNFPWICGNFGEGKGITVRKEDNMYLDYVERVCIGNPVTKVSDDKYFKFKAPPQNGKSKLSLSKIKESFDKNNSMHWVVDTTGIHPCNNINEVEASKYNFTKRIENVFGNDIDLTKMNYMDYMEYLSDKWDEMNNKEDNVKNKIMKTKRGLIKDWQDLDLLVRNKINDHSIANKFKIENKFDIEKANKQLNKIEKLISGYKALTDMQITNIIDNNPHTIVIFEDGTKIVNKASNDDIYDVEKGVLLALVKNPDVLTSYGKTNYSYEMFEAIDDFVNRYEA